MLERHTKYTHFRRTILLSHSALCHSVQLVCPRVNVTQEHKPVAGAVARAAAAAGAAGGDGGRGATAVKGDDGVPRVGEVTVGAHRGIQDVGSLCKKMRAFRRT